MQLTYLVSSLARGRGVENTKELVEGINASLEARGIEALSAEDFVAVIIGGTPAHPALLAGITDHLSLSSDEAAAIMQAWLALEAFQNPN